mmetsp:Transcript_7426/g.17940  ORF Transcript_7426/g.17940 Transcript_7426/m.17940 type:complete len:342 (+) Transcript_7426:2559-3584(+)
MRPLFQLSSSVSFFVRCARVFGVRVIPIFLLPVRFIFLSFYFLVLGSCSMIIFSIFVKISAPSIDFFPGSFHHSFYHLLLPQPFVLFFHGGLYFLERVQRRFRDLPRVLLPQDLRHVEQVRFAVLVQLRENPRAVVDEEVAVLRDHRVEEAGAAEEGQLGVRLERSHEELNRHLAKRRQNPLDHVYRDADALLRKLSRHHVKPRSVSQFPGFFQHFFSSFVSVLLSRRRFFLLRRQVASVEHNEGDDAVPLQHQNHIHEKLHELVRVDAHDELVCAAHRAAVHPAHGVDADSLAAPVLLVQRDLLGHRLQQPVQVLDPHRLMLGYRKQELNSISLSIDCRL